MGRKKGPSFQQRKDLAEKMFGTSNTRPQDTWKNLMFQRRQINFHQMNPCSPDANTINSVNGWTPSDQMLQPTNLSQDYFQTPYILIDEPLSFHQMIENLKQRYEIALDVEGHDDHTFCGMISLIQLATSDEIYLFDPFPLYSEIKKELKEILEDRNRIVLVHGGDNDFLWMKRDFGFHVIGAVDMQYIHQSRVGGPRISFDDLVSYYLQNDMDIGHGCKGVKKIAQAADWTHRPLHSSLLEYAANDVRFLMIVWHEIKKLDGSREAILDAVQLTKKHLIKEVKPKSFSSAEEELRSLRKAPKLTITQMEIFQILWDWRNKHSRIVDESPRLLIPSQVLIHLAKYPPSTEEKIKEAFNGSIPHLLQKATKTIMRLVNEGRPYLAKMEATICNNCGEFGHAAYGCYLPNCWQNTKRYYDNHPELKARQNQRRRENKKKNRIND